MSYAKGRELEPVDPNTLTRWVDTEGVKGGSEEDCKASPFLYSEELNQRIILWEGDLCALQVDAVVNTTNERLNDRTGVSGRIFYHAGPELMQECLSTDGCHTGEAVITRGCDLHARFVIHTVGPRFSVKYQTAAENALHGCYRRSFEVLRDNELTSIAFPLVNTERKGYPRAAAANIACRTIRRFLEKFGQEVKTVVLCMPNPADLRMYEEVLPLYFPRSWEECKRALDKLPKDTGNELGEVVIPDRVIRISNIPGYAEEKKPSDEDEVVAEENQDTFASMQASPDEKRQIADPPPEQLKQELEYQQFLERAQNEDFEDLERLNFLYQCGTDIHGRAVVVFVVRNLPVREVDMERVFLFMIKKLDEIVENDYTVVYCHTCITSNNKPRFAWLKKLYSLFNRKYKKNMKRLFIVHPTFWVRLVLLFAHPFVKRKFWVKVRKLDRLRDMFQEIPAETFIIPQFITDYDETRNGAYYASHAPEGGVLQPRGPSDADL